MPGAGAGSSALGLSSGALARARGVPASPRPGPPPPGTVRPGRAWCTPMVLQHQANDGWSLGSPDAGLPPTPPAPAPRPESSRPLPDATPSPRPAGRNPDPTTTRAAGTTGCAGAGSGPPCVSDVPGRVLAYSRSEPAPGREKLPLTPEEKARLEAMDPGVRDHILTWLMLGDPILMREARAKLAPPRPRLEAPRACRSCSPTFKNRPITRPWPRRRSVGP